MAGQDFANIKGKYDKVSELAETNPAFNSVKAAMVKPMFCTAMANTEANLRRLPSNVRQYCQEKECHAHSGRD